MNILRSISLINYLAWIGIGIITGVATVFFTHARVKGGTLGSTIVGVVSALFTGVGDKYYIGVPMNTFNFSAFVLSTAMSVTMTALYQLIVKEKRSYTSSSPSTQQTQPIQHFQSQEHERNLYENT